MTTHALVRDGNGWRYRGTPGGGTVTAIHSDYTDTGSVDQLVDAELLEATDDEGTVSIQVRIVPLNGDDRPFLDFDLGDAIWLPDIDGNSTPYRVMSITVTEDANGTVSFDIEANSLAEEHSLRQQRFINLASPGSFSGRSDNVSGSDLGADVAWGALGSSSLPPFNQTTYLLAELDPNDIEDEGHSDWHKFDENELLWRHPWVLAQAGDTDTIMLVRYREPDQTTTHTFGYTIKAGVAQPDDSDADHASFYTNLSVLKDGAVQMAVDTAGDFAYGLEWQTKTTSQS